MLNSRIFFFVVLASSTAIVLRVNADDDDGTYLDAFDSFESPLELLKKKLSVGGRHKRIDMCNSKGDTCRGVLPCCGDLQCYWKDGYSITQTGVCVTCVQQNQICQRDKQCCSPLVCQKAKSMYTDGRCDVKRPRGGDCHESDQCMSGVCNRTWKQKLNREEGKCN